ncbi:MAG: heavy-metal-associated domain-containing protein, partial [Thermoleophilia bacterium]|nr:heavy-metal-associated domain-containing protein [Thermoleophilia bacterium]
MSAHPSDQAARERTDLSLEGMTCASCATRIERRLNKLDGVEAAVNFALERATVEYDPARVSPEGLLRAVEEAGYRASLPAAAAAEAEAGEQERDDLAPLRRRVIWAITSRNATTKCRFRLCFERL